MANNGQTQMTISLPNLTHNYNYLKRKIGSDVRFLAVVKAMAYGSDADTIALHLENLGVDYFAVAYAPEGQALRKAGIKTPIMVLHPQPAHFDTITAFQLEPVLYSFRILKLFQSHAKSGNYPIHIKFNTGLNRLGFDTSGVEKVIRLLESDKHQFNVVSILSHLAASEDLEERNFTLSQIHEFQDIAERFSAELGVQPLRHQCNTSGILNYPEAHFDMVRSGIGLYGFGNEANYDKNLKPIARLSTLISQIHELKPGESLGYNRAFVADRTLRTATLPIGHADGIDRIYGRGKGYVFINGQKAIIKGNVCMDMIMVDVTDIDCKEGDEVIIFDENHSAAELAEAVGTISYELVTGIAPRVPRYIAR